VLELTQAEITLLASGATRDPLPYEVVLEGVGDLTVDANVGDTSVKYTVRVSNIGINADTINLTTSGDAAATLSRTMLTLNSNASEDVILTIPGSEFTSPGRYEVNVIATSKGDNTQTATITTTTTALPPYDVRLTGVGDLTTETTDGGVGVQYTILVSNIGTGTETIELTTSGDAAASLSEIRLTLEGGASENVILTIHGSGLLNPGIYVVTVTAASPNEIEKRISIRTYTTILASVSTDLTTTVTVDLSGRTLDGEGYAIVAHDGALADGMPTSALPILSNDVLLVKVSNMPDLENFLQRGGTIDVYVGDSTDTPDVIINEIMWALDEHTAGTTTATNHQWIELYNRSEDGIDLDKITLRFQPLLPVPSRADLSGKKSTDRFSNVAKFSTSSGASEGWRLTENHGQNGNTRTSNLKEFISMFRKSDKRGNNDGVNSANWLPSSELSHSNHRGTPGKANTRSFSVTEASPNKFEPPMDKVIINEVYNDSDDDYDWIELRALEDTNLHNWTLSYTRSDFKEVEILRFPKQTIEAGEVWLFVNKEPFETDLAAGQDFTGGTETYRGAGGPHKYLIMSGSNKVEIPDYNGGTFYLILRTTDGWERYGSRWRIHDVVGPARFARRPLDPENIAKDPHTKEIWETDIWPLNGHRTYTPDDTYLQTSSPYRFSVGNVWERNGTHHGWQRDGGKHAEFIGGIGYDRNVDPRKAKGTPGYHNDITESSSLRDGQLVISELMLTTTSGNFPQWIEIHNTSKTDAIDLHKDADGNGRKEGWTLEIENADTGSWETGLRPLNVIVKFRDLGVQYILPNQTILISGNKLGNRRHSGHFPDERVAGIWDSAKEAFAMEDRNDMFLNAEGGFHIKLVDGSGEVSDEVGNLDGSPPRGKYVPEAPYSWHWPTDLVDNKRTSLIRIYDNGEPRPGTPDRDVEGSMRGAPAPLGTQVGKDAEIRYSWVHAADTKYAQDSDTYYGIRNDYGTPGYIRGTPLPVSLSTFSPVLENGEVVIRWITESELDNAGFNILRSETRNGIYKQVNPQLIQGAGTTGERNTYKWIDTTAKTNVVYYYQIEDVSFAGERQVLAITKLKGLISAKNKLTTIWGELKRQD
jgi:hypothetical protein